MARAGLTDQFSSQVTANVRGIDADGLNSQPPAPSGQRAEQPRHATDDTPAGTCQQHPCPAARRCPYLVEADDEVGVDVGEARDEEVDQDRVTR
eukprot:2748360-Rhodomonas_salina.1